jgi:hypothetical protein
VEPPQRSVRRCLQDELVIRSQRVEQRIHHGVAALELVAIDDLVRLMSLLDSSAAM